MPIDLDVIGELACQHGRNSITARGAELLLTPLFISHPRTHLKWRLMADVLIVVAFQFSHPVAKFVLMETDYVPFHP